jgi:membrane protease YdiL (CAAX protease family)
LSAVAKVLIAYLIFLIVLGQFEHALAPNPLSAMPALSWGFLLASTADAAFLVGASLWLIQQWRLKPDRGWIPRRRLDRDIILGAIGGAALVILVPVADAWSTETLGIRSTIHPDIVAFSASPSIQLRVALGLLVCFVDPVAEELFFRGAVQMRATQSLGTLGAIAVSSVAFAFVHIFPSLIVSALASGIVLSLLAARTRGVVAPSVAHVAFNVYNLLLMR